MNLESVQGYMPPPQDLARETLGMLQGLNKEIEELINKQK